MLTFQKGRNHFGGSPLCFWNALFIVLLIEAFCFLGSFIKLFMFNQKRRNRFGGFPLLESPFRRQGKTSSQVFPWPFPAEQGAAPLTNPTQIETMPFLVWYTGCRTDTAGRFCAAPSRGVFRKWGTLYTFYRLRFPTRFNSIKAQAVFF